MRYVIAVALLAVYRIVLFDQRGCGKSRPSACLEENTTPHLIDDIEVLRKKLNVDAWVLFGGSWGSTLALAYAQRHPNRVRCLILRGIFTLRKFEIEWLYERSGVALLHPSGFENYVNGLPPEMRDYPSLREAYYKVLTGHDEAALERAATAMYLWEASLSHFPGKRITRPTSSEWTTPVSSARAISRIESHYFEHGGFVPEEGFLLKEDQMAKVRHLPAVIVHGRWDLVCPVRSAYDLCRMWPEAQFKVVENAGHSAFEPGITDALLTATDAFRYLLASSSYASL